ncbi:aldo/keto reductase [Nocardioides hankookensis]|uniref:Aldo/keto reductase n=1 Tax=Nocardioides hankookensis TaxID=443157 RepID=A0ABW1LJB8_9ACTN
MRYREIGTDDRKLNVSVIALGAMLMGSRTDEETSFAILDRFVEAGGTFIDTANNYAFWVAGDNMGGQSEELLGRWRRDRGIGDEIKIATKVGGRPLAPGHDFSRGMEALTASTIKESAERSLERMGLERLDLYYAHVQDLDVPLEEQVEAFGQLAADGTVGLLGASNHWAWRVERARALAAAAGLPAYDVLQYSHSYLKPRTDQPALRAPEGDAGVASAEIASLVRDAGLHLVAYSPLLGGAYVREDKPMSSRFDHSGTPPRLAALHDVARQTGATPNQVVLSWLIGGELPVVPLVGASSVAQLDDTLAALDLDLTAEQRELLDGAG